MSQTTTYGYDAHGNIVKKTMPNGETITQTYDALNRVTKIEGQKPSAGGLLYRYGYRYDLAGNIVHIREDYSESPASWREIQQTYDRAHRLVSEQYSYSPDGILGTDEGNRIISYRYDEADNRTQKSIFRFAEQEDYTYNTLNQLTHLGADERSVDYEYDLNGNRILRTEDTAITGYAYDYDNRLVAVTNNTLEPAYAYNYDYRTRRVGIVASPDTGSPATTTLSFSGGTSVQEYTDSTLNVEYIRGSDLGGGIGGILYTIREGDPSFTHYNSRGDVVAKTNSANTLTYQAAYESYGTRSDETGSTLDRQKANTKDEDPTGLLNEGFRYRDLETGEFITRDPAGFINGPNLYTYVRQNPWTKFDPEGLEALSKEDVKKAQDAIDIISKTKAGRTKVGRKVVANLKRMLESGQFDKRVITGAPGEITKFTPAGYDDEKDQIVLDPRTLSRYSATEIAALLGHEGVHKVQYTERPKQTYAAEMEDEAFIFENALRAELDPTFSPRTRSEITNEVDLAYSPGKVKRLGQRYQPLEGQEEVNAVMRELYSAPRPSQPPVVLGVNRGVVTWVFPNGDVRSNNSLQIPPSETSPVLRKENSYMRPPKWD